MKYKKGDLVAFKPVERSSTRIGKIQSFNSDYYTIRQTFPREKNNLHLIFKKNVEDINPYGAISYIFMYEYLR